MSLHPRPVTLFLHAEGELRPRRATRVDAHLAQCPHCRECVETLRRAKTALTPARALSDAMTDRLMARLPQPQWRRAPVVAEIQRTAGSCRVRAADRTESVEAFEGLGLQAGDRIELGEESLARIEMSDGSRIWLNQGAEVTLGEEERRVELTTGEVFAEITPRPSIFTIDTPAAELRVLGTTFEAGVTERETTFLKVLKGKVSFANEAGEAVIGRNCQTEAPANTPPTPVRIPAPSEVGVWRNPLETEATERASISTRGARRLLLLTVVVAALLVALAVGYSLRVIWPGGGSGSELDARYNAPRHTSIVADAPLFNTDARWPIGTRFVHRLEVTLEQESALPGLAGATVQQLRHAQDVVFDVLKQRRDGSLEIELSFADLELELGRGSDRIYVDSDSNLLDEVHTPLGALIRAQQNARLQILLDGPNEAKVLDGFENFRQSALGKVAPGGSALIRRALSEDYYKGLVKLFILPPAPSGPLQVGAGWTSRHDGVFAGSNGGQARADYTFERWDLYAGHQCAVIDVVLSTDSTGANGASIIGSGKIWFDPDIGMNVKTAWALEKQATAAAPSSEARTGSDPVITKTKQSYVSRLTGIEHKQ